MTAENNSKPKWKDLQWLHQWIIYPFMGLVLTISIIAWNGVSEQMHELNTQVAKLQTAVALNQASKELLMKMVDKMDRIETRMTRQETILELHREESTYDNLKKFPLDKNRMTR